MAPQVPPRCRITRRLLATGDLSPRVTEPGAGPEPEHGGQVQRVGPAGEGFFDDPVVAELLGGHGQALEQLVQPE